MKVPTPKQLPLRPLIQMRNGKKVKWTVEIVPFIPTEAQKTDTVGLCDYTNRTISVTKMKWTDMFRAYIHETLHAMDDTLSEKQVQNLEKAICEWWKDNL